MPATTTLPAIFRTIDGVRIRHADSGGSHQRTVVLTSPWPESAGHFVWEEAPAQYASAVLDSITGA